VLLSGDLAAVAPVVPVQPTQQTFTVAQLLAQPATSFSQGASAPSAPPSQTSSLPMVSTAPSSEVTSTRLSADQASGTLFVSPTGSDSNDGRSANTAFRSIGQAARVAQAGDVVDIRGGTYNEYVALANSGTAEKPIVFAGHPGETVVLDGSSVAPDPTLTPGNMHGAVVSLSGDYVTIKNLEVTKSAGPGVQINGNHDVVDALHIHGNFGPGVNTWKASYGLIQNSTVHDNYDRRPNSSIDGDTGDGIHIGLSNNMTVRNNAVYHNSDDGIDCWDGNNNLVEGNTIYSNGYGIGGDGEGVKIGIGTGNVVRNNTAYDNRLQFDGGESGGNTIEGNTAYNTRWVDFTNALSNDQPSPNVFKNNTGTKTYQMNNAVQSGNSWQV
jgi:parallel beta-helix repeat protein